MKNRFCFYLLIFGILLGTLSNPISATNNTTTVAIVDFTNNSGKYLPRIGENASEILSVLLVQTNKFNVVERDKLRSVILEQSLTASGLVDNQQSAVQIGKLLGADLIITGSIVSFGEQTVDFEGYGIRTRKTVAEMVVSVKVLNITTGKIESAFLVNETSEQNNTNFLKTYNDNITQTLLTKALHSTTNQLLEIVTAEKESLALVEVAFLSDPAGADLEINGVYYGSTPLKLQLKPGIQKVTISFAGFIPWEKKINAYEGLEIKATLEKKPEEKKEDD